MLYVRTYVHVGFLVVIARTCRYLHVLGIPPIIISSTAFQLKIMHPSLRFGQAILIAFSLLK